MPLLLALLALAAEPIFEARSAYSHIIVDESPAGMRHLKFDDVTQSTVKLGDPKHLVHDYTQTAMLALAVAEPKRALVIGLGGGSMPMFVHAYYADAVVDVVDIDPAVVDVARKFFEYKDAPPVKTYVEDGAAFVERAKDRYDVVFLDAYSPDFIPPQMATAAFFEKLAAHVSDRGVVVSNVWGPPNPAYAPMLATQKKVFKNVYVVQARRSGNYIFIALNGGRTLTKVELVKKALAVQTQKAFHFDLAAIVDGGWQP